MTVPIFVLKDEDGTNISISLNQGASKEDIFEFETKNNINIPCDLRNLLLYSNGLNMFGIEIMSLDQMEYFNDIGVLAFHNWGNGDFDCIAIKGYYEPESVLFMNHSIENMDKVTSTFSEWIAKVVKEIEQKGVLFHPWDFANNKTEGLYRCIFEKLHKT